MIRIVPFMQSANSLMIPEEPLCSWKLHCVATEVLNCLNIMVDGGRGLDQSTTATE